MSNDLQNTIIKYPVGSVYYYNDPYNRKKEDYDCDGKDDFLINRPILVVSNKVTPANKLTVYGALLTKSERRIGISVVIERGVNSKILPYDIRPIKKANLGEYLGQLPDEVMQEVKQAILYHMDYTDELPKYLHGVTFESVGNMLRKMDHQEAIHESHGITTPVDVLNKSVVNFVNDGNKPNSLPLNMFNSKPNPRMMKDKLLSEMGFRKNGKVYKFYNDLTEFEIKKFSEMTVSRLSNKVGISYGTAKKLKELLTESAKHPSRNLA